MRERARRLTYEGRRALEKLWYWHAMNAYQIYLLKKRKIGGVQIICTYLCWYISTILDMKRNMKTLKFDKVCMYSDPIIEWTDSILFSLVDLHKIAN